MKKSILYEKKIGIIAGSWSGEREEAIVLGKHLEKVLKNNNIEADLRIIGNDKNLLACLKNFDVDFAFLETTEEVPVQPILDSMNIAYSGSDNLNTALSMNKEYIKNILKCNQIDIPDGVVLSKQEYKKNIYDLKLPVIIKPVSCGSSCGVSLVYKKDEIETAIKEAFKHGDKIIIEDYIEGREITIPVVNSIIMPAVEIKSKSKFWNEEEKCNLEVEFNVIPLKEKEINEKIKILIDKMRTIFDFKSFWRLDTIYRNGILYVLEVNTLPCMAGGEKGIIPTSLKEMGWTHFQFLSEIAEKALS